MTDISLPSFPLRPLSVGRWKIASKLWWPRQEQGKWRFQPKINGFRAVDHCPTQTLFNRKGGLLSIRDEFAEALDKLKTTPFFWLDCEALERRHAIGKGSLIVLDWMEPVADHKSRRFKLAREFKTFSLDQRLEENHVYLIPEFDDPDKVWEGCKAANRTLGCDFYEGLIGRHVDGLYGFQLSSPDKETTSVIKSRWRF